MRNIVIEWLHKAADMSVGSEIYLPVVSKADQKSLHRTFIRERNILADIDAKAASGIHIYTCFKDAKFWVVLKRVSNSPLVGFLKEGETVTKVNIVDVKNEEYSNAVTKGLA
jgi:hypothetical protein